MSSATRKSNNNPSLFFKHQRSVMLHKLCAFVGQLYVNTYMTLKRSAGFLHCYYIWYTAVCISRKIMQGKESSMNIGYITPPRHQYSVYSLSSIPSTQICIVRNSFHNSVQVVMRNPAHTINLKLFLI